MNLLEAKEWLGVGDVSELVDGCVAVGGAGRLHHCPPDHPGDVPQAPQSEGDVLPGKRQGRGAGKEGKKSEEDEEGGGVVQAHPDRRLGRIPAQIGD